MQTQQSTGIKKWWKLVTAPFRLLRIEKIYYTWFIILFISYAGCFVDWANGEIGDSLLKGILFSTSFAVLAPFTIDFLVYYLGSARRKKEESFSGYKAWSLLFCFVTIFLIGVLYATKEKSNIPLQFGITAFVCILSFYTHLVNKMDDHPSILDDCKDVPYAEAERKLAEELNIKSANLESVRNRDGKEVTL